MDFGSKGGEREGGDTQELREWGRNAGIRSGSGRARHQDSATPGMLTRKNSGLPSPPPNPAAPGEDFGTPWSHWATPTSPEVPPHPSGILPLPAPAPGRRQAPEFCRERGIRD